MQGIDRRWLAGAFALASCVASATDASDLIFFGGFDWSCASQIALPDGARTRQPVGNISYGTYPQIRPSVDMTEWNNLWGLYTVTDNPPLPWPGVYGSAPVIRNFGTWSYVGAHFRTDAAQAVQGHFAYPVYVPGPDITLAISAACGDFAAHLPAPGCISSAAAPGDMLVAWRVGDGSAPCSLQPYSDYYVNIIVAHPDAVTTPTVMVGVNSIFQP